jgi:hypothetical protein
VTKRVHAFQRRVARLPALLGDQLLEVRRLRADPGAIDLIVERLVADRQRPGEERHRLEDVRRGTSPGRRQHVPHRFRLRHRPGRFADSRGRVWIGANGSGMTIGEAEKRAAALLAETAALRAANVLYLPRRVG